MEKELSHIKFEKMQIEIHLLEIVKKFINQLQITTEAITHIYHAVSFFNEEEIPALEVDSLPFVVTRSNKLSLEERKEVTLLWSFKKSFEEFILGLSEALIEAHKVAKYFELSQESRLEPTKYKKESLEKKIIEIKTRPHGLNFPTLISEIEKVLQIELFGKEEILSINRVRNCLVHRGGIVLEKDLVNKTDKYLQLVFFDFITVIEKEGKIVSLTLEDKRNGLLTNKMGFEVKQKAINFAVGEKIKFDANVFNNVAYTCTEFVEELHNVILKVFQNSPDIKLK